MPKILKIDEQNIQDVIAEAVEVLRNGGVVIYPTETMYGIGADATNQRAVDKLLKYKARREGKPLSIAVSGEEMAREYVEVNSIALNLYKNFLPGPITVVSKSLGVVAKGVESEIGTLGIRVPAYPLILDIIKTLNHPITASSANASSQKRPYCIDDVIENISKKQLDLIDLILDAGTLPKREPSTVVDTTLNQEIVLRQGNIRLSQVMEKKTESEEETRALGEELIKKYIHCLGYKSVIFALQGELGAGKTQLSKGIARGVGIEEEIQSPTFTIEEEYEIKGRDASFINLKGVHLYHIDTWRLFNSQELLDLQFIKKVEEGNVFIIEWADKVRDVIDTVSSDAVIVWVGLDYGKSENERLIKVSDFSL